MQDMSFMQLNSYVIDYYNHQDSFFKEYFKNLENKFLGSLEDFNNVTNYVCKNNEKGETVLFNSNFFQYKNLRFNGNSLYLVPDHKLSELNELCKIKEENEDRFNRLCNYSSKLLGEIATNSRVSIVKLLKVFPEDMVSYILSFKNLDPHEIKNLVSIKSKEKESVKLSSKAEFFLSNIENDINLISMNSVVYA